MYVGPLNIQIEIAEVFYVSKSNMHAVTVNYELIHTQYTVALRAQYVVFSIVYYNYFLTHSV